MGYGCMHACMRLPHLSHSIASMLVPPCMKIQYIFDMHAWVYTSMPRYLVKLTFQVDVLVTHCPSPSTFYCRGSDFEALLAGELGSQEGGEGEQD